MANAYVALDLMHLEHRVQRFQRQVERREWRNSRDPFSLHDDEFIDLFRLSPDAARDLVDSLTLSLERQRPYGLSAETQVLTALRFYATGSYQGAVGEEWELGVSQPSVSRCVHAVTRSINELLLRQWVYFPMTAEERYSAVQKFRDARQPFPGTFGAIDCTYLKIISPKEHEEAYVNHWGDHTLNVQAICDPDLKILNINARYPGARHDAYVWSNSAARRAMERNFTYGERNTWLIGDDGYALEPWLMTPLKNEILGTPRFQYNEELCAARSVVERLFGLLKGESRCLSQQRQLMYDPVMSGMIANARAVLHNMRIAHRLDNAEIDAVEEQGRLHRVNEEPLLGAEENANQRRAVAQRIQQSLITRHYGRH